MFSLQEVSSMNNNENPSYYAIIPANVRYDKDLPANAKLLYGEITALCNKEGYCWASNDYFANLYGVSIRSVKLWIKSLSNKGYINCQLIYKKGSKEVEKRIIRLDPVKKSSPPSEKNFTTPSEKNCTDNNTRMNNTINNISSSKDEGEKEAKEDKGTNQNEELFNQFWEAYPKKRDKQTSRKAFTKLHVDVKLFDKMMASLSQFKKSYDWQKNGGQFIPYPSTWLNGRRWEDELTTTSKPQAHTEEKKENTINNTKDKFSWL